LQIWNAIDFVIRKLSFPLMLTELPEGNLSGCNEGNEALEMNHGRDDGEE
jgi:hypothetical protein